MLNPDCGIYKIQNKVNQQVYIGQSIHIKKRFSQHRIKAYDEQISSYNYPLYEDMREYGLDNFDYSILELCPQDQLNDREIYYISKYDSYYNGYNQTKGGSGIPICQKIDEELYSKIIDDLKNSSLDQNEIAKKYDINFTTISMINTGKTLFHSDINYPVRNNRHPKNYCIDCGIEINRDSIRCIKCAHKLQYKVEHPDKDILEKLLKENLGNFAKLGRYFGVTDNTIRKWCKSYELPYLSRDYQSEKIVKEKQISPESQSVAKIDIKTGEVIATYPSVRQAEILNGNSGHISQACRGIRKTCQGYKWKFVTNE